MKLSLLMVALACASAQPPQDLYREAVTLQQQGKNAEAIPKYEALISQYPDIAPIRSNLGAALSALGRYPEAQKQFEEALRIDPSNSQVSLNLALVEYKMLDFEKAAAQLLLVRKKLPDNRQALLLLGDCYLRLGENKKVIALLSPYDTGKPEDAAVGYMLGTALIRDGQTKLGEGLIDRLLRNGESPEVKLLVGSARLSAQQYEAAWKIVTEALAAKPDLPGGQTLLGMILMELDKNEEAKAALQKALQQDPADFDANLRLGAILRMENQLDPARKYIEQALKLRPKAVAAQYQLGSIDLAQGKPKEAVVLLEAVVKESPGFVEGHVQLAQAYARAGRAEDVQRERAVILELQEKVRKASEEQQLKKQ